MKEVLRKLSPNTASLALSGRDIDYINGYEAGFESAIEAAELALAAGTSPVSAMPTADMDARPAPEPTNWRNYGRADWDYDAAAMVVLADSEAAPAPVATDTLKAFAEEVKQLCRDFCGRDGAVYVADVEAAIDPLLALYLATPTADRPAAPQEGSE